MYIIHSVVLFVIFCYIYSVYLERAGLYLCIYHRAAAAVECLTQVLLWLLRRIKMSLPARPAGLTTYKTIFSLLSSSLSHCPGSVLLFLILMIHCWYGRTLLVGVSCTFKLLTFDYKSNFFFVWNNQSKLETNWNNLV